MISRRTTLDLAAPERFLSAGPATQPFVPPQVPYAPARGFRCREFGLPRITQRTRSSGPFCGLGGVVEKQGVGRVCQASLRRAGAGVARFGSLYSPHRHLPWTIARPGRRPRAIPRARLERSQSDPGDVPRCRPVHPALSAACAALRLRPDPVFRVLVEPQSKDDGTTRPRTITAGPAN